MPLKYFYWILQACYKQLNKTKIKKTGRSIRIYTFPTYISQSILLILQYKERLSLWRIFVSDEKDFKHLYIIPRNSSFVRCIRIFKTPTVRSITSNFLEDDFFFSLCRSFELYKTVLHIKMLCICKLLILHNHYWVKQFANKYQILVYLNTCACLTYISTCTCSSHFSGKYLLAVVVIRITCIHVRL